jgi:hypothetical protein
LCRVERRKSVRSSESLRGNRRARWPEHPLINGMAAGEVAGRLLSTGPPPQRAQDQGRA